VFQHVFFMHVAINWEFAVERRPDPVQQLLGGATLQQITITPP
jgi:hypothetical protein